MKYGSISRRHNLLLLASSALVAHAGLASRAEAAVAPALAAVTDGADPTGASEPAGVPRPAPLAEAPDRRSASEAPEIVVTGTNLRTSPDAVIVPVVTIDSARMEKSGVATNVLEVLRKNIPAFEGRSNTGSSNANNGSQYTAGGSQVQLRNLPTLVLINGRRAAISGAGAVVTGKSFVDVNQIPVSAVARIEVLTDGASSIYGSDAIGGVVNIILKSDFEGLNISGRAASADGHYRERSVSFVAGKNFGNTNITVMGSTSHSSPLLQSARSFTSPLYNVTSALPGVVANGADRLADGLGSPSQRNPVGTGATAVTVADLVKNGTYVATTPAALSAGFDVSQYQYLLLRQDNHAIAATLHSELIADGKLDAFGDFEYSANESYTHWLPVAATGLTVPGGAPFNPLKGNFTGVTFSYLPIAHEFYNETNALRGTIGLRGRIGAGWHWETGLVYSRSELEQRQPGLIYSPNLAKAIAGGFDAAGNAVAGGAFSKVYSGFSIANPLALQPALDPFAVASGVNPASLQNLFGTEIVNARSTLASFDAKISGSLFSLPAGPIDVALGVSARREFLSGYPDPNGRVSDPVTGLSGGNSQNWLGGIFFDPFSAHRKVYAVFAEARLPLTSAKWGVPGLRALDLTLAGREEKYSDAGYSFAPKIGFRWQPFDNQITIRGNYSKSFAAPSLYFEFSPPRINRTSGTLLQGAFGVNYSGMPYNSVSVGNPNLRPTTSTSRLLGITFRPAFLPRLKVNVDYVDIDLRDFPGSLTQATVLQSVNALGSASPYFQSVTVDAPNGMTGATHPFTRPGDLLAFLTNPATGAGDPAKALRLYNSDGIRNLGAVRSKTFTIAADYVVPTERYGAFTLSTVGAILKEYSFIAVPGNPSVALAGHSTSALQFAGTMPKYSFRSSLDWTYRDAALTIGNTYMSATTDTGTNGTSTPAIPVKRYVSWDLRAAYNLHLQGDARLKLAVGVNNVGNAMPPLAPRAFPDNRADASTFSPIGRLFYATISAEF